MKKKDFGFLMENLTINYDELVEIAVGTGFVKRKRLIDPLDFLSAVCLSSAVGITSYNDIAAHIDADSGLSVSRQAIGKKVKGPCEEFLKKILAIVITNRMDNDVIRLPLRLFSDFSGVANGLSKVCNARIQCVYDLVSGQFELFSIDPYSKNDLTAAPELVLKKGDLVLRDRGYLITDELQRHIDSEAHCIYRYKFNMALKDPETEKPIDLLSLLKKKKHIDMKIMLNNETKTIVRLLAYPVSKEVADSRRRKAKKEKKQRPTKEYLESLSWSIYITTITDERIDYAFIYKVYGLRWRIEIIFKCWKSNMAFDKIHNVSRVQLNVLLLGRFIMVLICTQLIFWRCRPIVKMDFNRDLSLLKLTKYLLRHTMKIVSVLAEINDPDKRSQLSIKAVARLCVYDKRKRRNYQQKIEALFC
jgi:hypothetical protein